MLELVIALALIALLASLGTQAYAPVQKRIQMLDGRTKLIEVMQKQQAYFLRHQRYTVMLDALGYAVRNQTVLSDREHFTIEARACPERSLQHCIQLLATPTHPDHTEILVLDSSGQQVTSLRADARALP